MTTFTEFFQSRIEILVWTLLNSVWQSLAVLVLMILALRMIPLSLSRIRYGVACAAMMLVLLLNAATFIYLLNESPSPGASATSLLYQRATNISGNDNSVFSLTPLLTGIRTVVDANMSWFISIWIAGAILFSLRLISGWWVVSRLRADSISMNGPWSERLQVLARQLGIDRIIALAQSTRIDAPVVIGFLKPVILIPAGMVAGLSTEQIETIFIHELAHIRRHDYLINILQSVIEAILFFNPFVWIISNTIRREREYCCDDAVVKKHGGSMAYAQALTQLEEVRLTKSAFALSLAENKNQLLNRIKRLMENSAKNYSGKEKLIPALLIVIGLACASWLTISTEENPLIQDKDHPGRNIKPDTIIKKNKESATYTRKSITTYDKEGKPHEEVVEKFEGDEALRPLLQHSMDPGKPGAPSGIPPLPDMDEMMAPWNNFGFSMDSLPAPQFGQRDWEEFNKAFGEKFSEQFKDFYSMHQGDLHKLMQEMEEQFENNNFNNGNWHIFRDSAWSDADSERMQHEMERWQNEDIRQMQLWAQRAQEEALQHMQQWRQYQDSFGFPDLNMKGDESPEENNQGLETRMESFQKELKQALVNDGYLKKSDEIKSIYWDTDGDIKVNDKKIKDADRKKYEDLHRKYFKDGGNYRYVE